MEPQIYLAILFYFEFMIVSLLPTVIYNLGTHYIQLGIFFKRLYDSVAFAYYNLQPWRTLYLIWDFLDLKDLPSLFMPFIMLHVFSFSKHYA